MESNGSFKWNQKERRKEMKGFTLMKLLIILLVIAVIVAIVRSYYSGKPETRPSDEPDIQPIDEPDTQPIDEPFVLQWPESLGSFFCFVVK